MKQMIATDQWHELADEDKLIFWNRTGNPTWTAPALPLPTIGNMIEFIFQGEILKVYALEWRHDEELADVLWSVVQDKLADPVYNTRRQALKQLVTHYEPMRGPV